MRAKEAGQSARNGLLMTADFGTSGAKGVLWSARLEPLATAYCGYETDRPTTSHAEQDPGDWWSVLRVLVGELFASSGRHARDLLGVGFSGHYPSMLPLDANGRPVTRAWIWMDERGESECETMVEQLAAGSRLTNMNPVRGFCPVPKILWMKRRLPEVFDRTHKIVQLVGYLTARLTGRFTVDMVSASWFHTFDYATRSWSKDLTAGLGIPPSIYPDVCLPFEVVGHVTADAAAETGLPAGCPVIAGTGDAVAAALGAGVSRPGQAYMTTGTGGCLCVVTDAPVFAKGLITEAYVHNGLWLIEGVMKNVGVTLKWFRQQLGQLEEVGSWLYGETPYRLMDREAEKEAPGSGGLVFLPYLDGEQSPIDDPNARGILFGMTLSTTRGQIVRAMMEGVACAARDNLKAIESKGQQVRELRMTGGPIQSRLWAQIFADVTQRPVLIPEQHEPAPLGVALLAAFGLGLVDSLDHDSGAAPIHLVPNVSLGPVYDRLFERYRDLYRSTRHLLSDGPVGHDGSHGGSAIGANMAGER